MGDVVKGAPWDGPRCVMCGLPVRGEGAAVVGAGGRVLHPGPMHTYCVLDAIAICGTKQPVTCSECGTAHRGSCEGEE